MLHGISTSQVCEEEGPCERAPFCHSRSLPVVLQTLCCWRGCSQRSGGASACMCRFCTPADEASRGGTRFGACARAKHTMNVAALSSRLPRTAAR